MMQGLEPLRAALAGEPVAERRRRGVSYSVVSFRLHPVLVVLLVVAICGGLILGVGVMRNRRAATPQALVAHLPAEEGVILAIDFAALRRTGILAALSGTSVAQEPEYKSFVVETGFDYEQDLDYAVAWFGKDTTCVLLRGRFDWARLRAPTSRSQGGVCRNSFCRSTAAPRRGGSLSFR